MNSLLPTFKRCAGHYRCHDLRIWRGSPSWIRSNCNNSRWHRQDILLCLPTRASDVWYALCLGCCWHLDVDGNLFRTSCVHNSFHCRSNYRHVIGCCRRRLHCVEQTPFIILSLPWRGCRNCSCMVYYTCHGCNRRWAAVHFYQSGCAHFKAAIPPSLDALPLVHLHHHLDHYLL